MPRYRIDTIARPEKTNAASASHIQEDSPSSGHDIQDCQQIRATGLIRPATRLVITPETAVATAPLSTMASPMRVGVMPPPSLARNSTITPPKASPRPNSLRRVSRSPGRKYGASRARKIGWA